MRRAAIGVVMLAFLLGASAEARADCKAAAVPTGDPALVRSVSDRLAASGVATTSSAGCPAVRVRVESRGGQVHLQVTDVFDRLGERDVADVATAAAIIESWTQQVIEEGELPPVAEMPSAPAVVAVAHAASSFGASFESSLADDGSTWLGAAVSGCARLGPTCVGARVVAAKDTNATGDTATIASASTELDALATAELPVHAGGWLVSPGVGLGYGWLQVTVTHMDAHMNKFDVSSSSHALRGGAHVKLLRPLGWRLAIYGDLAGDAAIVRTDIANAPRAAVRLGLGLQLEAL